MVYDKTIKDLSELLHTFNVHINYDVLEKALTPLKKYVDYAEMIIASDMFSNSQQITDINKATMKLRSNSLVNNILEVVNSREQ